VSDPDPSRPHDHLVEPLYAGLSERPADEDAEDEDELGPIVPAIPSVPAVPRDEGLGSACGAFLLIAFLIGAGSLLYLFVGE
jgi:hypothetical protein